jgi:hypothetical protein
MTKLIVVFVISRTSLKTTCLLSVLYCYCVIGLQKGGAECLKVSLVTLNTCISAFKSYRKVAVNNRGSAEMQHTHTHIYKVWLPHNAFHQCKYPSLQASFRWDSEAYRHDFHVKMCRNHVSQFVLQTSTRWLSEDVFR